MRAVLAAATHSRRADTPVCRIATLEQHSPDTADIAVNPPNPLEFRIPLLPETVRTRRS